MNSEESDDNSGREMDWVSVNNGSEAGGDKSDEFFCWVETSDGYIPDGALVAGEDINGEPLFVCRVIYLHKKKKHMLVGKLVPTHKVGYVAFNGKEHAVKTCEVLIEKKGMKWKNAVDSECFVNAVAGGHTHSGDQLFIGRTRHHGVYVEQSTVIGYFDKLESVLHFPFAGKEVISHDFEYLSFE